MYSEREFVEMSFSHINKAIRREGKAEEEVGIEVESANPVRSDLRFTRNINVLLKS
jgi:GDP-D-mannose dehydratase